MIYNTPKQVKAHTRNWLYFCIKGLHTIITTYYMKKWPTKEMVSGISLLSPTSKTEIDLLYFQLERTLQALKVEYPQKEKIK